MSRNKKFISTFGILAIIILNFNCSFKQKVIDKPQSKYYDRTDGLDGYIIQYFYNNLNMGYKLTNNPEKLQGAISYIDLEFGRISIMEYPPYSSNRNRGNIIDSNILRKYPLIDGVYKCYNIGYNGCIVKTDYTHIIKPEYLEIRIDGRTFYDNQIVTYLEEYGDTFKIKELIKNETDQHELYKLEKGLTVIRDLSSKESDFLIQGADSLNLFIRNHPSIRKLNLHIGNINSIEISLSHLLKDVKGIDTLIIKDISYERNISKIKHKFNSEFPMMVLDGIYEDVKFLYLDLPGVNHLPKEIFRNKKVPLESIILCSDSIKSIDFLMNQPLLKHFELLGAQNLKSYDAIYTLPNLEKLSLIGTNIENVSNNIIKLNHLKVLQIEHNNQLEKWPEGILCMPTLEIYSFYNLGNSKAIKYMKNLRNQVLVKSNKTHKKESCAEFWTENKQSSDGVFFKLKYLVK